jgi:hypothetical protein
VDDDDDDESVDVVIKYGLTFSDAQGKPTVPRHTTQDELVSLPQVQDAAYILRTHVEIFPVCFIVLAFRLIRYS